MLLFPTVLKGHMRFNRNAQSHTRHPEALDTSHTPALYIQVLDYLYDVSTGLRLYVQFQSHTQTHNTSQEVLLPNNLIGLHYTQ